MIETFAHRLAQKLISLSTKNTVTKDDIAVVSYGIECLLNLCIPFFFFLIYSCFTHRILGMVYFLISFLFLRNHIGGFHAKSHIRCMLYSTIYGLFFLWLLKLPILPGLYIKLSIYGIILAGIAIGKPICQTYINSTQVRRNSYITIILECLCMICYDKIWHSATLSTAIFLGSCAAAILYIPGRIFQHNT